MINGFCEGKDRIRLGYVISKKIGKATVRNKLKRQVKEIFRNLEISNAKSINVLFIAKKPILNLGFYSLKDQIYNCMDKYLRHD